MQPQEKTRLIVEAIATAAALVVAPTFALAHEGWGIVPDGRGGVYVADIPRNAIWQVTPDGRSRNVLQAVHSHALVAGPGGHVHGTDVHYTRPDRRVWRIDRAGRFTEVVPGAARTPVALQSFLIAGDGVVWGATPYEHPEPAGGRRLFLVRWTPGRGADTVAGGITGHADGTGSEARFSAIDGMAWLPDSSIVIADGPRLRRVRRDGRVETIGSPLTASRFGEDLLGVSVAPDGSILAADFAGRRVWRVLPGQPPQQVGRRSHFWSPTGAVQTPAGDLYILEHARAPFGLLGDLGIGPYLRVRHVAASGRDQVLDTIWGRRSAAAAAAIAALTALAVGAWRG